MYCPSARTCELSQLGFCCHAMIDRTELLRSVVRTYVIMDFRHTSSHAESYGVHDLPTSERTEVALFITILSGPQMILCLGTGLTAMQSR